MNDPVIFDCWTAYGPRPNKDVEERWTLDHLLGDLDFYGIAGALVRHEQACYYDALHVNRRLTREIRNHRDRLFPCWTVLPHQAGDFPVPEELIRMMDDENVRAVSLRPVRNAYPIDPAVLGPLAEVFNARKTLILTTLADLNGSYDSAVRFCRIFNRCPVLIGESDWGHWRLMVAIMEACSNARMELHLFQANRAPEYLSARFGIDRFLFGSGLLSHSAGAARGFVDWSLLDDQSNARFAAGNLSELLDEGPGSAPPIPPGADPIVRESRAGKPLTVPVFDAHCHVLDDGLNGAGGPYVMIKGDWANLLALHHRCGIDLAALMSWSGTVGMDVEAGNALIEKVLLAAPEEVIGLSTCDPTHQTPDAIRKMLNRYHLERGFRGFKPYPTNSLPYNHPGYTEWWEFGQTHRLYALLHTAPHLGGMSAVDDLAARFPDVTFLIAHSGGSWAFAREVCAVALKRSNVMAELTLTPVPNGIIEWLSSTLGPDRVLFGTDAPMRDPRPQLGWCVYTRLGLDEKQKILGRNFARVLNRGTLPGHDLPRMVRALDNEQEIETWRK